MSRGRPKKVETNTFSNGQSTITNTVSDVTPQTQLQEAFDKLTKEHELLKKKYRTARKRMAEKGI